MAVADRHRDDVGRDAGKDHRRRAHAALRRRDLDEIALRNLQALGRLRVDLHPAAPHRGRQRIRHLLQPRQVRGRSVAELRRFVREEMERELRRVAVEPRFGVSHCGLRIADCGWRLRIADFGRALRNVFRRLPRQRDRRLHLSRDFDQHVGRRARLVNRLHHRAGDRLHRFDRARLGRRIHP